MRASIYGAPSVRYQTFKALSGVRRDVLEAKHKMETITPAIDFSDTDEEEYWLMMIAQLQNIYGNITKFQQMNTRDVLDGIAEVHGEEPWK